MPSRPVAFLLGWRSIVTKQCPKASSQLCTLNCSTDLYRLHHSLAPFFLGTLLSRKKVPLLVRFPQILFRWTCQTCRSEDDAIVPCEAPFIHPLLPYASATLSEMYLWQSHLDERLRSCGQVPDPLIEYYMVFCSSFFWSGSPWLSQQDNIISVLHPT